MITIEQSPNLELNASNSDVLYVLSSDRISEYQYQYVCYIYDQDTDIADGPTIVLKQRPNASGYGVFNLGDIIHNRMDHDIEAYNVYNERYDLSSVAPKKFASGDKAIQRYVIRFGEEWSDTINGPINIYNGTDDSQAYPALSGSATAYTYFVDTTLHRYIQTGSNWDLTEYYDSTEVLTDAPEEALEIELDQNFVVGVLNGPEYSGSSTHNDVYELLIGEYDSLDGPAGGGTLIAFTSYTNTDAGDGQGNGASSAWDGTQTSVRTGLSNTIAQSKTYDSIEYLFYLNTFWKNKLTYVDLGTKHHTFDPTTKSYQAIIRNKLGFTLKTMLFNIVEPDCTYPTYRLAWLNEYNCFDYYNFTGVFKRNLTRTDQQFTKGFINYGITSTSESPYNRINRGRKNYNTLREEETTINTKFVVPEVAQYLEGLFMSPEVYLMDDDGPIPIVLTTATMEAMTDEREQKLTHYEVKFKYSNNKRSV